MITNYKQSKEEVLRLYSDFIQICEDAKFDSAGTDTSIKALKNQAENIRQDRFLLMIAGEAKSGKSTFINAYLGESILPMDIKQCTSSIVEICYGENFTLIATYADGRKKQLTDENAIKNFLLDNAALNDEYRDIPIPTINNEILIKYKGKIPEHAVKDLIKGVQTENIHNLSPKEYENKILKYIETHKNSWKDIVAKMNITYPIKDESLRGIEIIDSPGVNADGRVGDITESYIENADAVMFLKPMTGQALESTSFKKFMTSKSMDRNKNALFMILTRAANETEENRNRIYQEALKQFKRVEKEHVILVDSKVEMFLKTIQDKTIEEIQQLLMELGGKKQLEDFILAPWFTSQMNKEKYIEALREKSNFTNIETVLNRFGRKSHYIALSEFLGRMLKVYTKMQDSFNANIKLYETKAKDPVELGRQITMINNELVLIYNKMSRETTSITKKYTSLEGILPTKIDKSFNEIELNISNIENDDMNELEKVSFRKIDEFKKFQEELQKNIVADCNDTLVTLSNIDIIPWTSLEVDFTVDDLKLFINETEEEAKETEYYTTGKTFQKTESRSVYSRHRHFDIVKNHILEELGKIKHDIENDLFKFVEKTVNLYVNELANNTKMKSNELTQIVEEKKTAEEMQEAIDRLKSFVEKIEPQRNVIKEIKGGIDNYV